MMRFTSKKRALLTMVALAVVIAPGAAYAHSRTIEERVSSLRSKTVAQIEREYDVREVVDERAQEAKDRIQTAKDRVQVARDNASGRAEAAKARLQDAQLKRCEAREKAITNIMARIGDRGQKQLDLFTTIAERVDNFYTEKGYELADYESLMAKVDAKREAAQTVVSGVAAADTGFACEGDNPRAVIDDFKSSLKEAIAALKEYRTAVKNLIVGVKSAQPADVSDETDEEAGQ